jgi:hypothetical protein
MEKFFGIEQIEDHKRVKMAYMTLKGHAYLWWDNVELERQRQNQNLGQNGG